ncbi:MAG: calcium/sodium antiporter [Nevskiales bacterium]
MLLNVVAIAGGLLLLIFAADRFIAGASTVARRLGAPPLLIGLTIVGLGTSAPEMLVSATAAFNGNPNLGAGNAIGSNITNVALILGVTALVVPLTASSSILRRELPLVLVTSIIAYGLCMDGELSRLDGSILVAGAVLFLFYLGWLAKRGDNDPITAEFTEELNQTMPLNQAWLWLATGLILLPLSSQILVWGAVNIATSMGISELVIGLTIVAIGTSLPELAASLVGALKGEHDLALGNVLGSNMFNLLVVLCMPGLIAPGPLDPAAVSRDMPVMLGLTVALIAMCWPWRGVERISRGEAALLLVAFIGYEFMLYRSVVA